jgi:hypothetical protein
MTTKERLIGIKTERWQERSTRLKRLCAKACFPRAWQAPTFVVSTFLMPEPFLVSAFFWCLMPFFVEKA